MAKPIYVSGEEIDRILREVKSQLMGIRCTGGIDIKKNFTKDNRKATIYFTPEAWNRVLALVMAFETEVQWHGCVNRISNNEFEIYDIIVPPHVVTGSTVTSDPVKYSDWITSLDDEVFNNLRFHGHSHVNMGCSPSGTDMKYRRDIVTQLPIPQNEEDDSFYIFLILNKKGDWSGEIYDVTNNALFSEDEIEIEVYDEEDSLLSTFIEDAMKKAVKEVPAAPAPVAVPGSHLPESYYEQPKSSKKKNGKKEEKSWKDYVLTPGYKKYDGDEDDPTSPFFVRGI